MQCLLHSSRRTSARGQAIATQVPLISLLLGCALGCSGSSTGDGGNVSSGGAPENGGASSTGGTAVSSGFSTGGASTGGGATNLSPTGGKSFAEGGAAHDTGGSSPWTGGTKSGGGSNPTGGVNSTGGTLSAGGASGAAGSKTTGGASSGGNGSTGGAVFAGGSSATGGSKATGGVATATGGSKATGGATATGGNKASGGAQGTGGTPQKCSVYIAGDSTVSTYTLTASTKDQAGWGQMLQQYYNGTYVTVVNKAVGGMTARHFIQAGNLDAILTLLKAGDYFLVQFGTNDSNTTATYTINGVSYPYYAAADTDFKTYLKQYIDGAKAKGSIPVLVTPPPRNSAYCGGGRSMANYAQAMIDLGKADGVAVVDLSIKTWTYLNVICPKPADGSTETFFKVNADNTIDGTHFQENGAIKMAGFVADGIGEAGVGFNAYRTK